MENRWVEVLMKNISIMDEAIEYRTEGKFNVETRKLEFVEPGLDDQDDVNVSILIEDDQVILERDNETFYMKMIFNPDLETHGDYHIKEFGLNINLQIYTDDIKIEDDFIFVKYYLKLNLEDQGLFELSIRFKEGY